MVYTSGYRTVVGRSPGESDRPRRPVAARVARRPLPHRFPQRRSLLPRSHPLAPRPATHLRRGCPTAMTLSIAAAPRVTFPASADVDAIIRLALNEDVGRGDITTEATVPADAQATAEIYQKASGVVCGLPV